MADTANTNTNAWLPVLKAAFPLTIPICLGFLFLGASYGILMGTKGFSFVWPMCMSAFIFAGSMEFVTVNLLLSAFNPLAGFLLALMVNARHLFYGLSMLGKFKGLGWKRPYLIFGMCDETLGVVTFCWTSLSVWSLVSVPDGFRRRARAGCVCP